MTTFHAVLTDECGGEFGATIIAATKADAYETAREQYPESSVVQMESPMDAQERQARIQRTIAAEYDDQFCLDEDW